MANVDTDARKFRIIRWLAAEFPGYEFSFSYDPGLHGYFFKLYKDGTSYKHMIDEQTIFAVDNYDDFLENLLLTMKDQMERIKQRSINANLARVMEEVNT